MSLDALSLEQRQAFVLLGMCRGPWMLKSALQFLYNILFRMDSYDEFYVSQLINDLRIRDLVFENTSGYLSVHSLTKRFILDVLHQEVDSILVLLGTIRHPQEDIPETLHGVQDVRSSIISVLICQYIDVEVQKDLFFDLGNFDKLVIKGAIINSTLNLVMKLKPAKAAQAKLGLLGKVLLEFISEDHLDQDSIVELLVSRCSMLPILKFLENLDPWRKDISFVPRNCIHCSSSRPSILQSLLYIVQNRSWGKLHDLASRVFNGLCRYFEFQNHDYPGVVPQLATLLGEVQDPNVQSNIAEALATCLHVALSRTTIHDIPDVPGLLNVLGDLLRQDETTLDVRCVAGEALFSLTKAMQGTIVRQSEPGGFSSGKALATIQRSGWSGLFEGLAKSLTQTEDIDLQHHAVGTLNHVAAASDSKGLNELLNHSGLVKLLVQELMMSLREDKSGAIQSASEDLFSYMSASCQEVFAKALFYLSAYCTGKTIRLQISEELLDGLGTVLAKPACNIYLRHNQQQYAAGAIANLSFEIEKRSAEIFVNHPGLVDSLVKLVHEHDCDDCFMEAARALINLMHFAEYSIRTKGVNCPLLVERLMFASWNSGEDHVCTFFEEQDLAGASIDWCRSLTESFYKMLCNDERTSDGSGSPDEAKLGESLDRSGLVGKIVKFLYEHQSSV